MAAYAHESITVADTAIGLTAANINLAASLFALPLKRAVLTFETAQVRGCWNGTTPTSTVGHLFNPGDMIELNEADARAWKAIRVGASGAIKATYEVAS